MINITIWIAVTDNPNPRRIYAFCANGNEIMVRNDNDFHEALCFITIWKSKPYVSQSMIEIIA